MMMNDMSMTMTPEMMQNRDMDAMQACMDACAACEQASTMCAEACAAHGMGRCSSMCMSTADVANTMMRMLMRPMGMDDNAMMAMLDASAMQMRACAEECMSHADMHDQYRLCATMCMEAADACEQMRASMMS